MRRGVAAVKRNVRDLHVNDNVFCHIRLVLTMHSGMTMAIAII